MVQRPLPTATIQYHKQGGKNKKRTKKKKKKKKRTLNNSETISSNTEPELSEESKCANKNEGIAGCESKSPAASTNSSAASGDRTPIPHAMLVEDDATLASPPAPPAPPAPLEPPLLSDSDRDKASAWSWTSR